MADNNKLELVVEVDVNKANASIKSINTGLSSMEQAAHTDKMSLSMAALAKAHGVNTQASSRAVEAVKKVGFGTQDAIHAVDRLMVADMNLSKAEGLAKVAKDAAAIENITPGEALEKLLMAIESGASRGLR